MKEKKRTWYDLTLEDKIGIDNLINSELSMSDKIKGYLYIVYNKEIDDIPLAEVDEYIESLNFLGSGIPIDDVQKKYVLNGRTYVRTKDINQLSSGQYLDYTNYLKEQPVQYNKILATLLIPEGHKYCDGYDFEEVCEDMLLMKVVDVNSIAAFFLKRLKRSIKNLANYSILKIWTTKTLSRKQKKELTKQIDQAITLTEYSTSLWQLEK